MEVVFLLILLLVLVGVVWWRIKAKNSAAASSDAGQASAAGTAGGPRAEGALSGGGTAASAEAAGATGISSAAGFGAPAEPAAPTTADETAETTAAPEPAPGAPRGHSRTGATAVGTEAGAEAGTEIGTEGAKGTAPDERRVQDQAEWETQWSEASGPAHAHDGTAHEGTGRREGAPASATASPTQPQPGGEPPVHHPEYTEPHAPTLPGAETAAVEDAGEADREAPYPAPSVNTSVTGERGGQAAATGLRLPDDAAATETQDRAQSSALVETGADHAQAPTDGAAHAPQEPAGHLAAEEPYGEGSASPAADGSGPADYTVKGDAGAMVYYEEGHPEYEQARAEVWFESAAHAEAAGFRAPRRRRL
jgi:hypothetical protein